MRVWKLGITGCLIFGAALLATGANSVTLAWDPSPGQDIASYKIYFGPASGVYTNTIDVGNATNATITSLVSGVTYYFAATATDTSGLESEFSNEVSYTVPAAVGPVPLSIQISPGRQVVLASAAQPGVLYFILSSPDLASWNTLGVVTAGTDGTVQFTDPAGPTNRAAFYRLQPVF